MIPKLNIFFPHCSSLLTDHLPHGDGLVACGFIRNLAKRGHTLHVVAEAVDLRQPLPGNVHVTQVKTEGPAGLLYRLRYMGKVRELYLNLNRETKIDVIHQLNPVFTGLSLAVFDARAPLILGPYVASWPDDPDAATARMRALGGLLGLAKKTIAHLQQSQAAALLVTTPAAEDRLASAHRFREKIYTLPHGVDTEFFSPREEGQPTSEDQDILFLSNLVERKGLFDLLKAFDLLAERFPLARLLIAGDGPEMNRAKKVVGSSAAANRVVFLGHQTREQSVALLRRCAIFCQPSHGEPFGMSAAEAMSCARPLVVTNAGGLGYLVDDQGGLHVRARCPEELAQAIGGLLADATKRYLMGEHNRQRAVSSMSWGKVVDRLEHIYRRTMQRSSGAPLPPEETDPDVARNEPRHEP